MERDVIVYFGIGFLPEGNAVACRQQTIAQMIKSCGYTPVLIGVCNDIPWHEYKKDTFNGIDCYSVRYASSLKDKLVDSFAITKAFMRIFESIGVERIKCFIMQDYQFNTMFKMRKLCRKSKIAFVADLMDWFTPTRDYSLAKNVIKSFDMLVRANLLYPFLKNKIYISSKFHNRFKNPRSNEIIFPCTCTNISRDTTIDTTQRDSITITFAGEPGLKFQKEKLDWIVKALYESNSRINLNIIGITRDSFISRAREKDKYLTEFIHFYGRLPRSECVSILQNSDFSIIARKPNKLTMYGFSSKICESFCCGIPVIATATSDNKKYIKNNTNGFVCDANYESLRDLLSSVGQLDRSTILQMHNNLYENNPLSADNYKEAFSLFVSGLIL